MSDPEIRQYQLANANLMANVAYVTTPLNYKAMRSALNSVVDAQTAFQYNCLVDMGYITQKPGD